MIGVRLMGGLGNMMFQVAFIESLGKKYGTDVVYTDVDENCDYNVNTHHRPANGYFDIFKNINWYKNQDRLGELTMVEKVPDYYKEIVPEDGTEFVGYFQHEKYFDEELVRMLFLPTYYMWDKILSYFWVDEITCSIHVRRGDYLRLSHVYPVLDMGYYQKAMDVLNNLKIGKFMVFSDDMDWCKENFIGEKFVFVNEVDYIALFLMARCNHHIMANSSFSWWASYLGGGAVVAPSNYVLGDRLKEDLKEIIPSNWIKI